MVDCLFCKIIKKEIPADIIYEDKEVIAFLDIKPVHPGHTLLIPKEHHPMMGDTPDDFIADIFVNAKKIMKAIKKATNADFVAVSVIGIEVPHFHIHLIPRYKNDGLSNSWPTKEYKKGEAKNVAEKIKGFLK